MNITPELDKRLDELQAKYQKLGQDMPAYLEGLQYSNSLNYWDYLQLPALLALQTPRTDIADEMIFIGYHQITELYFKLILHEVHQICSDELSGAEEIVRLERIVRYYRLLVSSQEVMVKGMDLEQFLQFRMALLPASGFQSLQFRQIELRLTGLAELCKYADDPEIGVHDLAREKDTEQLYQNMYWKLGNRNIQTGKKSLTLTRFEDKYDKQLHTEAQDWAGRNIYSRYLRLEEAKSEYAPQWREQLRLLDLYGNLFWRLSHYRAAARYLNRAPEFLQGTGGTNWQDYLPPRKQLVIYFPVVWTPEERAEWGTASFIAPWRHLYDALIEPGDTHSLV